MIRSGLSSVEEHRSLLAAESRKAGALEETSLTGDREQFLYSSAARPLFTQLD